MNYEGGLLVFPPLEGVRERVVGIWDFQFGSVN